MTKFLTLKYWQLFGLLIGLPMIFQFITSSDDPRTMFKFLPIMLILFSGLFFGWFYSLGTNIHKKLPENANMNLKKFIIFLFIPVVYLLFISIYMSSIFSNSLISSNLNPAIFGLILPVHLFSMFCIFYCLYFIAKEMKTLEWQKPVTFSDFAGDFFLIWFFPFGIWIIQPRINKLFENSNDNELDNQSPNR